MVQPVGLSLLPTYLPPWLAGWLASLLPTSMHACMHPSFGSALLDPAWFGSTKFLVLAPGHREHRHICWRCTGQLRFKNHIIICCCSRRRRRRRRCWLCHRSEFCIVRKEGLTGLESRPTNRASQRPTDRPTDRRTSQSVRLQ